MYFLNHRRDCRGGFFYLIFPRDPGGAVALLVAVGAELRVIPALDHKLRRLRRQVVEAFLIAIHMEDAVLRSVDGQHGKPIVQGPGRESRQQNDAVERFRVPRGVERGAGALFRRKTEDGWEVCIQM